MNTFNKIIVLLSILSIQFHVFSQTEYLAPIHNQDNMLWGYINHQGEIKIPYKFSRAEDFSDGLAYVCLQPVASKCQPVVAYINKKGEVVINLSQIELADRFDMFGEYAFTYGMFDFHEGLAAINNKQNLWGFIDKTGKIVIPCIFTEVGIFSEGLAYCYIKNSKTGYINTKGEWVITLPETKTSMLFRTSGCIYKGEPFKHGYAKMTTVETYNECSFYETILIAKDGKVVLDGIKTIGNFKPVD